MPLIDRVRLSPFDQVVSSAGSRRSDEDQAKQSSMRRRSSQCDYCQRIGNERDEDVKALKE